MKCDILDSKNGEVQEMNLYSDEKVKNKLI